VGRIQKGNLGGKEDLIIQGGRVSPSSGTQGGGLGVNFPADNISSALVVLWLCYSERLTEIYWKYKLQALQNDNKLNILSSPSITTLDNQKAYTENGERVPFVTLTSSAAAHLLKLPLL